MAIPPKISAVDRAIWGKICINGQWAEKIYKIVNLDISKIVFFYFILIYDSNICEKSQILP